MPRIILSVVVCAVAVVPALGAITVYTDEAAFTAQLQSGYYLENFDYAPWTTIVNPAISTPQSFAGNGWAYQISSPHGLSGQPVPPPSGPSGAVANYQQGDAVTVTFTGLLPRAVGGIFWVTDINGNFLSGQTVTVTLASGGTDTYNDSSNWDAFTGFISDSPITSMTLQSSYFATMDHLFVANPVPLPASILLGVFAVGLAGRKLRKLV